MRDHRLFEFQEYLDVRKGRLIFVVQYHSICVYLS